MLTIPPPILSRVYQELSNGMLGYNNAFKVAAIPYPFPLSQITTLMCIVLVIFVPFAVEQFGGSMVVSWIYAFLIVLAYTSLNRVATELENPFGDDENDLPLLDIMETFNDAMLDSLNEFDAPDTVDEIFDMDIGEIAAELSRNEATEYFSDFHGKNSADPDHFWFTMRRASDFLSGNQLFQNKHFDGKRGGKMSEKVQEQQSKIGGEFPPVYE